MEKYTLDKKLTSYFSVQHNKNYQRDKCSLETQIEAITLDKE